MRKQLRKVLEKKLAIDPEGYGLPLRGALTNYWKHESLGITASFTGFIQHSVWWQFAQWEFGNTATSRTSTGNWSRLRRQGGLRSSLLR